MVGRLANWRIRNKRCSAPSPKKGENGVDDVTQRDGRLGVWTLTHRGPGMECLSPQGERAHGLKSSGTASRTRQRLLQWLRARRIDLGWARGQSHLGGGSEAE